jgi:GAF domain-containing protein
MDSTLLDQIRHLCRDRAAYEHLKAILVQQERVHQLGWEEHYQKLISAQSSDAKSNETKSSNTKSNDILSNIIAREKALAQLADAIQRSPSLELVLQIAVQVAQKLLQVDRVTIFRCHPDGRGEFAADAIATGLISLADMPERQLSLARHMIESTDQEHSAQTIDSIRTSSLSSHIVTLLEQIGISSYAANKIYAGQEVWGTLVAFHGSAYHSWVESDRTSLSLIAAQIGIAISLANLRQQSQELTDDLETLRIELSNLQQTVVEIAESTTKLDITSTNEQSEAIIKEVQEIADLQNIPIPETELPPIFLASEPNILSDEHDDDDEEPDLDENITPEELAINFTQADISYVIMPDNLKVILVDEPEEFTEEPSKPESNEIELDNISPEVAEPEIVKPQVSETEEIEFYPSNLETNVAELAPELIESIELHEPIEIDPIEIEPEIIAPELIQQETSDPEIIEPEFEQDSNSQSDLDDDEPAIEPQFMETILEIGGNDRKATEFLLNVIDSYLEEAPHLVQVIDKALALSDHVRLLQSLYTLRLSSDYLGALTLSYQCRQLESAVKANYVVLIYACLSRVAIEVQRATDALRIARLRYAL